MALPAIVPWGNWTMPMPTHTHCLSCKQTFLSLEKAGDGRCPLCSHESRPASDPVATPLSARPTNVSSSTSPTASQLPCPAPRRAGHVSTTASRPRPALVLSAAPSVITVVIGDVFSFVVFRLIPKWDQFLNAHVAMSSQDVDRLANSRFGLLALVIAGWPWLLFFLIALITTILSAAIASAAVTRLLIDSRASRIGCALMVGLVTSTASWLTTAALYAGSDSTAVTVNRCLVSSGIPLLASVLAGSAKVANRMQMRRPIPT